MFRSVLAVIFKTRAMSRSAYREEYRGQGFTVNNFKAMQKADQYFNGLEITLSSWWYDDHSCWHLFNWPQAVDDRVMCAMYHAEQYKGGPHMLPSAYKGDFEKFPLSSTLLSGNFWARL